MAPRAIYWSHIKAYESCPQSFLWGYGYGNIDLGNGPGKRKTAPKRSEHHILMGCVLADVFEAFYNNQWYLKPKEVHDLLDKELVFQFEKQIARCYIDWNESPSYNELFKICKDGIFGFLKTLKEHKLVGSKFTKSELDMKAYIDPFTYIGGRADLVFERDDTGISIMDGKNGKRYQGGIEVDADQLKWYALCYSLVYSVVPKRLGFIFFRYPAGAPKLDPKSNKDTGEKETGIQWVSCTAGELELLKERAKAVAKSMEKLAFQATPSTKACKWCDYQTLCPQRIAQQEENRMKRGSRIGSDVPNFGSFSLSLDSSPTVERKQVEDKPLFEPNFDFLSLLDD